ncbi:hypothetical protein CEP54_005781 [Fusarium duplospermum]|uniref:Uncharacterized protein n=1 Tax=Fusarium duplospermum TaxID=1325734 RepID=A0A428QAR4_9HYPO|nr:hypothetical protein CEP54_005781 [Fusarium duplospermum]
MSSTCNLKVYMPIDRPDNPQLVRLSIRSLDKWQQNIAQHCPFVSPWSENGPGDAGADAGKRGVPKRSLLLSADDDRLRGDESALRDLAEMKKMREQRCVRAPPLADGTRASELSNYRLKGWELLHRIITDGLTSTDASRIPPCDSEQRVYILFVEETETGKLAVHQAVNLGTCPRNILMIHLDHVEKRGWRDIVWVGKKGEVIEYIMDKKVCLETLVWG